MDNCIQNFDLGRYIVGYTVGNFVLRRRVSGTAKRDFQPYIRQYTSPNQNFEYGYPHFNVLLQSHLKLERCKQHKAAGRPAKYDVINDIKLFPTVYRRIFCRKFLTLSNQTLRYKSKCIRIMLRNFYLTSVILPRLSQCHMGNPLVVLEFTHNYGHQVMS